MLMSIAAVQRMLSEEGSTKEEKREEVWQPEPLMYQLLEKEREEASSELQRTQKQDCENQKYLQLRRPFSRQIRTTFVEKYSFIIRRIRNVPIYRAKSDRIRKKQSYLRH